MASIKEKFDKSVIAEFKKRCGLGSVMAVPKIEKVVVNIGTGKIKEEREREQIQKDIALITGQKLQGRPARKSIATFKTREGMTIGYRATLRGKRMYDFIDRLVCVAIPRMRDFRGISESSIDEHGNMNLGIREHTIFPEMIGEDVHRIFSLQVTIVTSARSREHGRLLFELLGFPLQKRPH